MDRVRLKSIDWWLDIGDDISKQSTLRVSQKLFNKSKAFQVSERDKILIHINLCVFSLVRSFVSIRCFSNVNSCVIEHLTWKLSDCRNRGAAFNSPLEFHLNSPYLSRWFHVQNSHETNLEKSTLLFTSAHRPGTKPNHSLATQQM